MVSNCILHFDWVVAVAVGAALRHHHAGEELHGEGGEGALVRARLVGEGLEVHELRGRDVLEVSDRLQLEAAAFI